MAGEKFEEQKMLRCSLIKDVTSTLAQTKKLVYDSLKKKTEVGLSADHILHQSTDATSMTQAQPSYNDHQQKLSSTIVDAVIAQEKGK